MNLRLTSWNVNGVRACVRGGFLKWFDDVRADVVALQEIKIQPHQLPPELSQPKGFHAYWHPAEKPGYSGVAILSRREPLDVRYGIGSSEFDREGRVLAAEFKNYTVVSTYFPNSQRDHARLPFKLRFCAAFERFCEAERARGKSLFICGDWNIAHQEIDLRNPKSNQKNAGFLPEERAWLNRFLKQGYVDAFREFEPGPGHYTWWSYRPGVRERNIGWRLDYFLADADTRTRLRSAKHHHLIRGSDHCPVEITIKS